MTKLTTTRHHISLIDDVLVVVFAVVSILLIAFELFSSVTAVEARIIGVLEIALAFFFLGEFIYRLVRTKQKKHFLLYHWWELLAAIPITSITAQTFRGLRIIRALEVVRVIRASARLETAGDVIGGFTDYPNVVETMATVLTVVFGSAVIFYNVELGKNANVHSLWDAFWWATATLTTTGYGDIYPVTTAGRIIAIVLMLASATTMALFVGTVVQYLNERKLR